MDPVTKLFLDNLIVVYFFYGLAFFCMGLFVWMESGRGSGLRISRAFAFLGGFGILHGLHEWFEMFQIMARSGVTAVPHWLLLNEIRIPHLVISFILLVIFGLKLLFGAYRRNGNETAYTYGAAGALVALWFGTVLVTRYIYSPTPDEFVTMVDVLSRYILGIPGALLAAWAIILEQRTLRRRHIMAFGRDLQWAAWSLVLYGVVGQIFVPESLLFPSNVINGTLFLETFGFPIQFFRAVEATLMAFFFIRALRLFELERQNRLRQAQEERLAAQQQALETQRLAKEATDQLNRSLRQREELLGELLHQVVSAQEHERERIARELHDGTGQMLTGLGLGLAAARDSVDSNPQLALRQIDELKRLNAQALEDLRLLVRDLRPSVLDDLGLVPALQNQVRQFEELTGVETTFAIDGKRRRLQPELETVIFRIGQEGLNNIAKHANATSADVRLSFNENCLKLTIKDDGRGFDPSQALSPDSTQERTAWGLLGIQERVAIVGGACFIISEPGKGTVIHVSVPASYREVDTHGQDTPDIGG
jgi:signal transduction histidine kinase